MGALFSEHVSQTEAELAAASFTAPGSTVDLSEFVADILATDGTARTGLGASAGAGRFSDELAIVSALHQPMAVLHGAEEQLVSLDHLRQLDFPALWRGSGDSGLRPCSSPGNAGTVRRPANGIHGRPRWKTD